MKTYPALELRSSVRFPLKLQASITIDGVTQVAETHDISAGGVLLYMKAAMELGTPLDFNLELPAEVLGTKRPVVVRCRGRVMRCVPEGEQFAVAAVIDEYRFERSAAAGGQK